MTVIGKPTGKLAAAIDKDFGSYDNFRKEFVTKALTAFGSGWGWLVATPSGLKVLVMITSIRTTRGNGDVLFSSRRSPTQLARTRPLLTRAASHYLLWMYGSMHITWIIRTCATPMLIHSWTTWWTGTLSLLDCRKAIQSDSHWVEVAVIM
jgi:superoxide dismutase